MRFPFLLTVLWLSLAFGQNSKDERLSRVSLADIHSRDGNPLRWTEGNEYSDTFLYNGFRYKTIGLDAFYVWVSEPQRLVKWTSVLVVVGNEKFKRIDLDPEQFSLQCTERHGKIRYLKRASEQLLQRDPNLLRAHTIAAGESKRGSLWFEGRKCTQYLVTWTPAPGIAFEFPY